MHFIITCFLVIAGLATHAFATEALTDNFDTYSDGPIPSPWTNHSGSVDPTISSGEAVVTDGSAGDVNSALTGAPYADGTTLFAGFTARSTTAPAGSTYFAHFKDASTEFRGRIFVTAGGVADTVRFGISNGSSGADQMFPQDIALDTDTTLIVRLEQTGGAVSTTLWINPIDINGTNVIASDSTTAVNVGSFAIRQATGIGTIVMDDLTVATTFVEVVPTAPVTLTMATDNPTPANETTTNDSSNVVLGSFTAASAGGTATITQIALSAGGSASSDTDIASNGVMVYRDTDANGSFDSGTDQLVASGDFTVAGNLLLTALSNNTIGDGVTGRFFVVYNLAGTASVGETFTVTTTLTADASVSGDNPSTSRTIEMVEAAAGGGGIGSGGGCNAGTTPGAFPVILLALLIGLVAIRRVR